MSKEIYKYEECGDRFLKYKMDSLDDWDFYHIMEPEDEYILCKGCIYKLLYEHYRKRVKEMKDFVEDW